MKHLRFPYPPPPKGWLKNSNSQFCESKYRVTRASHGISAIAELLLLLAGYCTNFNKLKTPVQASSATCYKRLPTTKWSFISRVPVLVVQKSRVVSCQTVKHILTLSGLRRCNSSEFPDGLRKILAESGGRAVSRHVGCFGLVIV